MTFRKVIVCTKTKVYHNLKPADKYYLRKTTSYVDKVWVYFSKIENDKSSTSKLLSHI